MDQEKIGKFICENRKKQKITQEALAEKIGVSKNAVSKWERGINLPDASIMQELCKLLKITLNELFSGEKIPDNKYKEVADINLLNTFKNSVFTLKDKIEYFKNKWQKDHFFELMLIMIVIAFFIIYGFVKHSDSVFLFIIIGFISGIIENNRMMAYVEKHAYGKDNMTDDVKNAIKQLKNIKKQLEHIPTKKEAIEFLIQKTNLSKQECSEAYELIINLNFES